MRNVQLGIKGVRSIRVFRFDKKRKEPWFLVTGNNRKSGSFAPFAILLNHICCLILLLSLLELKQFFDCFYYWNFQNYSILQPT